MRGGILTFTLHTTQEGGLGATLYEPKAPNRLVLAQFQRIYRSDTIPSSYIDVTFSKSRLSRYFDCISLPNPYCNLQRKWDFRQ